MTHTPDSTPNGGTTMGARETPYTIAVTGGIASGKSLVGKYLSDKGLPVIDTDHLAQELLDSPNPAYQKVLDRFGADLVDKPGGPISREKLARIVFSDAQSRKDLEAILHPAIADLCQERMKALAGKDIVVVLVPLLFEAGLESKYDEVWCVLVDRDTQVERLKNRNGLSDEQARARINAQWPQEKKAARSHRIIDNSGTPEETFKQVDQCLEKARAQASIGQPVGSVRNSEYREILKRFAELATGEVLDRMGDVSTTRHKDAEAQLCMNVTSAENGSTDPDEHHLKVRLQMCVKNKKGTPESPDSPCVQCSCNCGDNCRKGCACTADCGCSCKAPTEPPKPPTPPGKPDCGKPGHGGSNGLLALLGLLAFLFAAGALTALLWFHPWNRAEPKPCDKPGVTCPEDPLKGRPILVLTDEQFDKLFCKSKCQEPPKPCPGTTCPPYEPPAPPTLMPPPATSCSEFRSPSATPPGFILPYLHNQVRFRVSEWTVRTRQNELGHVVAGRDNTGRLVVWMEFGAHCSFVQQWIVNYSTVGDSLWVDLFQAPNRFVGRTVYEYDNWGRLSLVKRLDGHQRPLTTATFERNPDGSLCKVVVRRFDLSGRLVDVLVSWYTVNATLMIDEFFQYELFGQFK